MYIVYCGMSSEPATPIVRKQIRSVTFHSPCWSSFKLGALAQTTDMSRRRDMCKGEIGDGVKQCLTCGGGRAQWMRTSCRYTTSSDSVIVIMECEERDGEMLGDILIMRHQETHNPYHHCY